MARDIPPVTTDTSVALVGAGAVAHSLGHALASAGFRITAVVSAVQSDAARLALLLGARRSGDSLDIIGTDVNAVFVCVPDDAIHQVASGLSRLPVEWHGRFVAHTSGGTRADALAALSELGANVASFHPIQSFPRQGPPKSFVGTFIGIEGKPAALEVAERIAVRIEARAIRIPSESKPRYHLAASMASNFFATLMATVNELYPDGHIFVPLVRETLANIEATGADAALTGPIARGDVGTLSMHLEVLRATRPKLLPAYAAMATETVRVAVRGRHISSEVAEQLLDVIAIAVEPE